MPEPSGHAQYSPWDLNYPNTDTSTFGTLTPIIGFAFGGMLGALVFGVMYVPLYFCLRPRQRYGRRDAWGSSENGSERV